MASSQAIRLELESFTTGWGFGISTGHSFASGGGVAYLLPGQMGAGKSHFTGPSGRYDVKVHYFDESDGISRVMLDVAGNSTHFQMDAPSLGPIPSAATAASRTTHQSIDIESGAAITVFAQAQGLEYAAIDYIEFIPVGTTPTPTPTPPAPTFPTTPQAPTVPQVPAPAPAPTGDTPETLDPFEQQVLALTNGIREKAGLAPLVYNPALSAAADKHSQDMAEKNYFSHTQPDGDRLGDRVRDEGYNYLRTGENIAAGYKTPEDVVNGWMNSSGHRANILNQNFEELGVGYYKDPDTADRYDHYWTQVFGTELDVA